MNEFGGEDYFEEPEPRDAMTAEEAEARAFEERRQREEKLGDYYRGLWQGLILGIFGNLLVSFLMEWLKELIPDGLWFAVNSVGLTSMTIITAWFAWKIYLTAGNYIHGGFFETDLRRNIKNKLKKIFQKIKPLILIVVIFFLFCCLVLAINEIEQISPIHNFRWKIGMTERLFIDAYGGIFPTLFSCVFFIILIFVKKFSLKNYCLGFIIAVLLSISFSNFIGLVTNIPNSILTEESLQVDYYLIGFTVSLVAVSLSNGLATFFKKSIKEHELKKFPVRLRNIDTFLLAASYAALAVLFLDLVFVPLVHIFSDNIPINIGVLGITDGIVLSPLLTPFFVLIFTLALILCNEIMRLFYTRK